jgi:Family of unknown function (DUF6328)
MLLQRVESGGMADDQDRGRSEQAERRDESEEERLDRNLMELLQELRVASIGVQFLFAFLLVVPFQQGFVDVTAFEKRVYYVTLLLTAAAGICLMAPVARHRLRFRDQDKKWIVQSSHKYAIAGMCLLGLAICGVILLISHYVYDDTTAAIATAAVALGIGWIWFGAPLVRELRDDD